MPVRMSQLDLDIGFFSSRLDCFDSRGVDISVFRPNDALDRFASLEEGFEAWSTATDESSNEVRSSSVLVCIFAGVQSHGLPGKVTTWLYAESCSRRDVGTISRL